MKSQTKTVYYCDHCAKHGLSRHAMEKHERYCTLNPSRVCRWALLDDGPRTRGGEHTFRRGLPRWMRLRAPLGREDIAELHDRVGGCPACMLAALRQSGVEYHYDEKHALIFDYTREVERYREDEREQALQEERWEIERTFL